MFTLLI